MKFINYLTSIAGIEIFPLISLLIFFGFFVVLAVWLLRTDKKRMNKLAAMAIESDQENNDYRTE
ncbi:MAG: CcoQ/FixQ family Cbb3-type cytochrome c oxidase assembly chaperone [Bacteroidia bacterium]|jgi:cbb3-type cytochrome oxidase subunit 3|nr:CcoQ/FixQ family Cbb3-type cytochrome c oxidase assembly chaperone [Bacteroidia bacterium]